jgi:uncharacterized protein
MGMKSQFSWIISLSLVFGNLASAGESGVVEFQLARKYLYGLGVVKDLDRSFYHMKKSADQGCADAMGGLGYFYQNGLVVEKDEKQAGEWFRKGAELGSMKARLNLGKSLMTAQPHEGLEWIRKAADQGLSEACMMYGTILYFGEYGVGRNYADAGKYLKIPATDGNAEACNYMGVMSETGQGTPIDTLDAEKWFRKAAMKGHVKAQSNLGRVLDPVSEDPQRRIEALAWLILAWKQGEVTAQKSLEDAGPALKKGEFEAATERAEKLKKQIQ